VPDAKPHHGFMKLSMHLGGGLRLRIVERPGLSLDAAAQDALLKDLRAVARSVIADGDVGYGVLSGAPDRLANAVITLIYDRATGTPMAFNALSILPLHLAGQQVELLHLGLVMVNPALRGRGMSAMLYGLTCVLLFIRGRFRPIHLSNVTQVPAVFGMVAETFHKVFPTPAHPNLPTFEHRILARQIMRHHRSVFGVGPEAVFDEDRSVIVNAYTGGSDTLKKTFDEAPKHRQDAYNAMCADQLDYARGDDFLQIGLIDIAAARNYLSRVVRPQSAPWLAGQLLLFAVQSAIAPVLQWFADDRQWGILRPRRAGRR